MEYSRKIVYKVNGTEYTTVVGPEEDSKVMLREMLGVKKLPRNVEVVYNKPIAFSEMSKKDLKRFLTEELKYYSKIKKVVDEHPERGPGWKFVADISAKNIAEIKKLLEA